MQKMTTLFKKDPNDLGRVIPEVNPENSWVYDDAGIKVYRKWDGTACIVIDGAPYKRYDWKVNKKTGKRGELPAGAIPCQPEPDDGPMGHWPHWVPILPDDPSSKWHHKAWVENKEAGTPFPDTTYELCGPHFQGNPEKFTDSDHYIRHTQELIIEFPAGMDAFMGFPWWADFLSRVDIEGVVFYHPDGRRCKLRKSDFGLVR